MDAQLTQAEINSIRDILKEYQPANKAIETLERNDGNLNTSFEELWIEKNGTVGMREGKNIWQTTLDVLRDELCGDEGFRARLSDYTKSNVNCFLF
jgi:hypothetical protein